jgi:sulfite exporter TauE/SafE
MNRFLLAFITGLTSGGISCVAVQGGLIASSITDSKGSNVGKVLAFLNSKLVAYTILGGILGLIGGSLVISPKFQGWFQIIVGLYMLATAARLLNLHPIFRYTVIQPPKFILKYISKISKDTSFFTPVFLGFLTILIPCGVTQAMMIYAVGTGSALGGAGIMFAFILGTFPVFFLFGIASSQMFKNKILTIVAAVIIALIGILSINTGQILRGSAHTLQNYWRVIGGASDSGPGVKINNGVQEVTIEVTSFGYKSDVKTLKVGVPVKLLLVTKNVQTCARSFVIPSLNYSKILPTDGTTEFDFTPESTGILTYTCSMGMYTGSFNVIE